MKTAKQTMTTTRTAGTTTIIINIMHAKDNYFWVFVFGCEWAANSWKFGKIVGIVLGAINGLNI